MVEIDLIDETFDIHITAQYDLSIQVSPDGYCFCILDPRRNKYILLRNYQITEDLHPGDFASQVRELQVRDEFLTKDYHSVRIIHSAPYSTLVPVSLFSPDKKVEYFGLGQKINEQENILYNRLRNTDAVSLFVISPELEAVLLERFPRAKIYHQSSPFIESILMDARSKSEAFRVYVNAAREFFDIAVVHRNKLELFNSFRYTNESDFAFFILYVFDQLKIDPEESVLKISGELSRDSSHLELIRTFVRNVSFVKFNTVFLYSYVFSGLPSHRFNNLLNLYNCES